MVSSKIKFPQNLKMVSSLTHSYAIGTPLLAPMYQRAYQKRAYFYGYTNGDILFGENLITSLHVVKQMITDGKMSTKVLITGRRLEHRLQVRDRIVEDPYKANEQILKFAKLANLGVANAQDYFIVTKYTYNWHTMPAYVIGRPAYDNCLVHMVVSRHDLYGVDATATIDAVHQVGRDGLKAGHKRRPDRGWNKVRCRGRWRLGYTHLLKHHTIFDKDKIICRKRPISSRGKYWKLYKKAHAPQMNNKEQQLLLKNVKPSTNILITEAYAYNSFVAKASSKAWRGTIVYLEMYKACKYTRKRINRYKNVKHECQISHAQRKPGVPSKWAGYKNIYGIITEKYSDKKFDMILVKGRARPQFAVWLLLSRLLKPNGLVYMFDTASGGRKHYRAAEDFFNVKYEMKNGKGIKVLKSKKSEDQPKLSFEEWLQEYDL